MSAANMLGCDLAAEVAATFGVVHIRVWGTSMVPAILPGDFICVERAGLTEVLPGEIVAFARDGRLIVHRLAAKSRGKKEEYLITRGDRMRQDDGLVSGAELIGRITQIERSRSGVSVPSRLNLMQQVICRLLRFSDRATYLYLRLVAL